MLIKPAECRGPILLNLGSGRFGLSTARICENLLNQNPISWKHSGCISASDVVELAGLWPLG